MMIRLLGVALAWLVMVHAAAAQPWAEYTLDIGDGYAIHAMPEHALGLATGGAVVTSSQFGTDVEDFSQVALTLDHVLLRLRLTIGNTSATARAYVVVAKRGLVPSERLTEAEFLAHPAVAAQTLRWKHVENPHAVWSALIGLVFFAGAMWPISVPLLLLVVAVSFLLFGIVRLIFRAMWSRNRPRPR